MRPSQKPSVLIPSESGERPLADLTVVEGEGSRQGTKLNLRKDRQKIGRRDDMDIRLADETVSREHASIWWQDGSFFIQDEASASGTMVNGQKVTRQALMDNDVIPASTACGSRTAAGWRSWVACWKATSRAPG